MRIQLITAAAVLTLSVAATAQTRPQPVADDEQSAAIRSTAFDPALAGTWKSAADTIKLTSDFDKSVWGNNASSVRTVELSVKPSGEATLRVIKKVVDGKGKVVPASTWIEEAQLQIGASTPGIATRVEHDTKVLSAVRLFPDDPNYKWSLDALKVKIVTFEDGDNNTLEIRYDTPEGKGSFWETLKRSNRSTGSNRSTRSTHSTRSNRSAS